MAFTHSPFKMTDGPGEAEVVLEWNKQMGELRRVDASKEGRMLKGLWPGGLHDVSDSDEDDESEEEEGDSEYADESLDEDGEGEDEAG